MSAFPKQTFGTVDDVSVQELGFSCFLFHVYGSADVLTYWVALEMGSGLDGFSLPPWGSLLALQNNESWGCDTSLVVWIRLNNNQLGTGSYP